jgi:AraC-like DNA-binding protein
MRFYDGIEFTGWGAYPKGVHWSTRVIEDYYTIQFARTGYAHIGADSDKNVRRYEAPFVWLMRRDRYFRFGNPDLTPWGHYFVLFKGPRAERYAETDFYPMSLDPPVLKISAPERFFSVMSELQRRLSLTPKGDDYCVHLLENLLFQIHEEIDLRKKEGAHAGKIRLLAENVSSAPLQDWNFQREAAGLGLSYSSLRGLFKAETGVPPHQYVIKCRLRDAAALLRDKSLTVQEAAARAGFDNVFYFMRLFKKHYSAPPAKYRGQLL